MQTQSQSINTHWRVREVSSSDTPPHNQLPWLPAQVPGHVHLDLHRAGVISDPFFRMHEHDVQWVDERDWVYETTFEATENQVHQHSYLRFNGLDTIAEISLNGTEIGRADNMYIPHEFGVNGILRVGENTLSVTFRSAKRIGDERRAAWRTAHPDDSADDTWDSWSARSFVRKAQYMFGWDWGPVLRSCGLWQNVELVTVPVAQIRDWKYDYEFVGENTVSVTVTVDLERSSGLEDVPLSFTARLPKTKTFTSQKEGGYTRGFELTDEASGTAEVPTGQGIVTVTAAFTLADVRVWKPNGLGQPEKYVLWLEVNGEDVSEKDIAFIGFRTVELIREPDADGSGEGFKFRVNGKDTFIKGANWIPNDSFPSKTVLEEHNQLFLRLRQAKELGFNMLRVWGGGLYESEAFYNYCDQLGILVWQDFPHACAYYPDTGEYADAARVEATAAVRRIRNHPCLALWCGNNENAQMFRDKWYGVQSPRLLGEHFYEEIFPEVLAAEDAKTPYINGSPTGGENPNDENFGDCHNWDVWHGRGDWTFYPTNDCRFSSEFGFASSCGLRAWDSVLDDADKWPDSPAVKWHDKTRKGYETFRGYVALHYPHAQTLEDWVYFSQLNQADALKCGIEHHRRRKGRCWGTLFWQFNDCWPTQSWAIVDSLGDPKAAYYACKRFYAPVLLSLVADEGLIRAYIVNDLLTEIQGQVTLTVERFSGYEVRREEINVTVPANGVAEVGTINRSGSHSDSTYISARFTDADGVTLAENLLLLDEPKNLALSNPGLTLTVDDDLSVTVKAERFAPHVWLRLDGLAADFDDNFFTLRAGESKTVKITTDEKVTADEMRGRLKVRTL